MNERPHPPHLDDPILAARLEAYAHEALSPHPVRAAHRRAAILAEARQRLEPAIPAGPSSAMPEPRVRDRRAWHRPVLPMPAAALLLALFALIGAGTALAASAPGAPLYELRVRAELAFLPADPDERTAGQLAWLDDRVAEGLVAEQAGDASALGAALRAYNQGLAAAASEAAGDPDREARLNAALGRHIDRLRIIAEHVPEPAREAIQDAIDRAEEAAETTRPGRPSDPPVGQPTDRPVGPPSDRPGGQPTDRPVGPPSDRPGGQPTDPPAAQPDPPANPSPGRPPEPGRTPPGGPPAP